MTKTCGRNMWRGNVAKTDMWSTLCPNLSTHVAVVVACLVCDQAIIVGEDHESLVASVNQRMEDALEEVDALRASFAPFR